MMLEWLARLDTLEKRLETGPGAISGSGERRRRVDAPAGGEAVLLADEDTLGINGMDEQAPVTRHRFQRFPNKRHCHWLTGREHLGIHIEAVQPEAGVGGAWFIEINGQGVFAMDRG